MYLTPPGPLAKRPPLIAKSPSSEATGSLRAASGGGRTRNLLLLAANLQALSGLLMLVFGVLCAVYGASLSRLGGGLWGGAVALAAGALGSLAALRQRRLHYTLHLALCLVSLAVSTLVLLLTITAAIRDSRPDHEAYQESQHRGPWTGQWCDLGLLGATSLHLLATLVAVPLSCRVACSGPPPGPHDLLDTKHHLVSTWLGRHSPQVLHPHHLFVDVPGVYTLPYPPTLVAPPMGLAGGRLSAGGRGAKRRQSAPRRPQSSSLSQVTSIEPSPRKKAVRKKRELSDEEIERTYTGLDREIAEEFISIAMQPSKGSTTSPSSSPSRSASSVSHIIP